MFRIRYLWSALTINWVRRPRPWTEAEIEDLKDMCAAILTAHEVSTDVIMVEVARLEAGLRKGMEG